MLNQQSFREIVSGRRRGVPALAARSCLRLASYPYSWVVAYRNRRYDRGSFQVYSAEVPVISVGNLSLGGTGKTPMIEYIASLFTAEHVRICIVSRGYKSRAGDQNDEAMELQQKLPHVPHVQRADRVAAARAAVVEHSAEIILLDDGFQHRRLARDLDVVLVDALEPAVDDHVFPGGTLREPLASLKRADVIVLTRSDLTDRTERERQRREIAAVNSNALWIEARHAPRCLINSAGESCSLDALAGRQVVGFCGIGNPASFNRTLTKLQAELRDVLRFPDHHSYTEHDLADVERMATRSAASTIICTEKDLVKIRRARIGDCPLWALRIGIEITSGSEQFEFKMRDVLRTLRS